MSILSTKNLTKQYGTEPNIVKALDDVNISVERGEFTAIIGTSGSGKSTLLNMLGGLDRPTSGSVKIDKFNLNQQVTTSSIVRKPEGYPGGRPPRRSSAGIRTGPI